jgi:hypothetical protein
MARHAELGSHGARSVSHVGSFGQFGVPSTLVQLGGGKFPGSVAHEPPLDGGGGGGDLLEEHATTSAIPPASAPAAQADIIHFLIFMKGPPEKRALV